MLERAGVRWVFGVPSGPVLPLIEAIRQSDRVRYVLTASETSAGFMAEAVGRITGTPGVCVSTVGPGATNLATGVGGAWLDRSPVIAITCTYASRQLGRRTQMLIDHQALFAPLSKASFRLEQGKVAAVLAEALGLAVSEPPGPVHLDFPEDVGLAEATESSAEPPAPVPAPPPPASLAGDVERLLRSSRRPIVVTGLTLTRAAHAEILARFLDTQRVPFVSTLHAKGFVPESHAGALGVMGRARRTDVQRMIDRADLAIAVGFDCIEIDYEDWARRMPVAHLSTEPVQAGTDANVVLDAVGDIDAILLQLASLPAVPNEWDPAEWAAHREALDAALRPPSNGMAAHHVLDVLRAELPGDAVIAYDVGAHTHQIATQWRTDSPHTALATNGWSSMGYGMPAAYAAKLARPEPHGRGRRGRRVLPDDGRGTRDSAAARPPRPHRRAQRRVARPDEGEAGAPRLRIVRRSPWRAVGVPRQPIRRAVPRRARRGRIPRRAPLGAATRRPQRHRRLHRRRAIFDDGFRLETSILAYSKPTDTVKPALLQ